MKKIIIALFAITAIAVNVIAENNKIEALETKIAQLSLKIDSLEQVVSLLTQNTKQAPADIEIVGDLCCGLAAAKDGVLYGYVNTGGEMIIAPIFEEVYDFDGGYARVKKDDKWGIISTTGQIVTPFQYSEIKLLNPDGSNVFIVKGENGLYGIIKPESVVQKCVYDEIETIVNERANFSKNGRWGYFDGEGKEVISAKYKHPKMFSRKGSVTVTEDGSNRQVKIDLNGRILKDYTKR